MRSPVTFKTEAQHRGAVLRVMCLALMMVVAAVASLNVALPEIARDTGASQTELQWIVDAYAIVFAALLLPAGAIGDRYGRKPLLAIGLALFGAVSVFALFVDSPGALIAIRAAMGVAAALIMPVTLSVITTIFPPEERGQSGRDVGRSRGRRSRDRPLDLRHPAAFLLLAVHLRAQRRPGHGRARRDVADRPRHSRSTAAATRSRSARSSRSSRSRQSCTGRSKGRNADGAIR